MKVYRSTEVEVFEHLVESPEQTVTHLHISEGKEIGWHHVDATVVVVPVRGEIKFSTRHTDADSGEEVVTDEVIAPGDIVRMIPDEVHNLVGLADSDAIVIKSQLR